MKRLMAELAPLLLAVALLAVPTLLLWATAPRGR